MGSLYVGGQWCPNCGAEYRLGFVECADCRVPLSNTKPPDRPPSEAVDHDEVAYDLAAWTGDQRGALELMLTGAEVAHGWEGDTLVIPHAREQEVDELIDAVEERESGEHPSSVDPEAHRSPEHRVADSEDESLPAARPARRFLGFLLDGALLAVVALVVGRRIIGPTSTAHRWAVPVTAIVAAIYEIGSIALWGRTVGKTIVGTRVVASADGSIPGWRRATVRWAVVVGPTVATLWRRNAGVAVFGAVLGDVWAVIVYWGVLSKPLHQGLHDRAAGTRVIQELDR